MRLQFDPKYQPEGLIAKFIAHGGTCMGTDVGPQLLRDIVHGPGWLGKSLGDQSVTVHFAVEERIAHQLTKRAKPFYRDQCNFILYCQLIGRSLRRQCH